MSGTVLLAVDIQKLITNEKLSFFDTFRKNVTSLISKARRNGIEVVHVRHDDGEGALLTKGNEGFMIHDDFAPAEGEMVFDKNVNSPFRSSGLLEYLRQKETGRIIVVGLQTEYCIDATVKCGFEHGFEMIVPEYCNTTVDNRYMTGTQTYHYYNDFIWKDRYARCVSLSEAFRLMRSI